MKKRIIFIGFVFIVGWLFIFFKYYALYKFINIGQVIGDNVTKSRMIRIRPGMNIDRIEEIIGKPLQTENGEWVVGKDGRYHVDTNAKYYIYAFPGKLGGFDISIVVAGGITNGIYIKYDDLMIYSCNWSECPSYYGDYNALDLLEGE